MLELDEGQGTGLTHAQIAHSYAVCPATITNIIRYNISPNSADLRRKVDGRAETHIIQMACSPTPEGHLRWTIRLLEEKACVELNIPIGREANTQGVKKTSFSLTGTPTGVSCPRKTQNS